MQQRPFYYQLTPSAMLLRILLTLTSLTACFSPPDKDDDAFYSNPKNAFEKKLSKKTAAEVDTIYAHICRNLDKERKLLGKQFENAQTSEQKEIVLSKARKLLSSTLCDSIFICWYGTGWDFNGTTTCPRQGNIACGYFVTTVLKQSGFDISRTFLAQQASSVMIKTFCPNDKIKTITNNQTKKVFDYMKTRADGVFLVGLDNHTGFIVKEGNAIDFIDADYESNVDRVTREPLEKSEIIKSNGYFMIGDLLQSDETMTKWLKGEKIGE